MAPLIILPAGQKALSVDCFLKENKLTEKSFPFLNLTSIDNTLLSKVWLQLATAILEVGISSKLQNVAEAFRHFYERKASEKAAIGYSLEITALSVFR